jgi:hypothetical protein
MKSVFVILILFVCSCQGQDACTLTFINSSDLPIDSIVLQKPDKLIFGKLAAGDRYTKTIEDITITTNNEGLFLLSVYRGGKVLSTTWGFHDFGMLASSHETFYIFQNGISKTEKAIEKPKEFGVYFYNASEQSIDSIINIEKSIIKIKEYSPRNVEIIYDYASIEKIKSFSISANKKVSSIPIHHDFDNWNYNKTFIFYQNDSLKAGSPVLKEPLEFIVDLIINIPISSDSVKVESPALVKTYALKKPNSLRIIFNFSKLKQHQTIRISTAGKIYLLPLDAKDLSNIHYNQKICYLEEKGISN